MPPRDSDLKREGSAPIQSFGVDPGFFLIKLASHRKWKALSMFKITLGHRPKIFWGRSSHSSQI